MSSVDTAEARSAAAWAALGPPDAEGTTMLWSVRPHPSSGAAALVVPPTPLAAGIDMPQPDYDALLTSEEHAVLVDALGEGWTAGI
ncbi:MAG TPA: hypothetical protein VIQ29_08940 [Ancylobacter sp.]